MLAELMQIIENRKANPCENSYTARLLAGGEDVILQKVGEEATEVILAAKGQGQQRVVEEVADLFYHTLVLLASQNLSLSHVEAELRKRHSAASRKLATPPAQKEVTDPNFYEVINISRSRSDYDKEARRQSHTLPEY